MRIILVNICCYLLIILRIIHQTHFSLNIQIGNVWPQWRKLTLPMSRWNPRLFHLILPQSQKLFILSFLIKPFVMTSEGAGSDGLLWAGWVRWLEVRGAGGPLHWWCQPRPAGRPSCLTGGRGGVSAAWQRWWSRGSVPEAWALAWPGYPPSRRRPVIAPWIQSWLREKKMVMMDKNCGQIELCKVHQI